MIIKTQATINTCIYMLGFFDLVLENYIVKHELL